MTLQDKVSALLLMNGLISDKEEPSDSNGLDDDD
jgi:hypothetical protein